MMRRDAGGCRAVRGCCCICAGDKHDGGEASSSREAAGANCITEFEMSSLELETNLREVLSCT